ncbi:mitochondrial ribosomal protein L46 [Rhodnius prolixus]
MMITVKMNLLLRNLLKRRNTAIRAFTQEINAKSETEKWDLLAGVSLERLPIITRDFDENEQKMFNLLSRIELENSHKSNFEVRLENDMKRAKELKEGTLENIDLDGAPQQTAQDFLDMCHEELKSFKFGSRKAEEKAENDLKSTRRALDRRLLLLIKEKIGDKQYWILPQGVYKGEESLRLTAERVLQEKCGNSINARFLGNCPCGFYKYKYPKHARNHSVGANIFFFKAQLLEGQVDRKLCDEFQWATRKELKVLPENYYKTVRKFLIDEEH